MTPFVSKAGSDELRKGEFTLPENYQFHDCVPISLDVGMVSGLNGTRILRTYARSGTNDPVVLFTSLGTNQVDVAHLSGELPQIFSVGALDVFAREGEYSLNSGVAWHPFSYIDENQNVVTSASFGPASANLIMLESPSSGYLRINQRRVPVQDLIANAEGYSDFVLTDINAQGQIVGTALYIDPNDPNATPERRAVMLLKVELTPNPIPATGVVRAKLDLGYLPDEVDLLEDMPNFMIQIDGTDVEDLRQDEYDPKVFYFTPPVFSSPTTADYDLSWSGLTVDGEAYPDLTLEDFAKYTTELEEGIEMFSDAIGVSIEEATSKAKKESEDSGLSTEESAHLFESLLNVQASPSMYFMHLHIDGRSISDDAADELDLMEETNAQAALSSLDSELNFDPDVIYGGGGSSSLPVADVSAIDAAASEAGADTARFSISRSDAFDAPLTVKFTLSGTATNGVDYTAVPNTVVIPANKLGVYVDIIAISDSQTEGSETVILEITADDAYELDESPSDTITIID